MKKLYLDSEQKEAIQSLYTENREYRARFNATAASQASAEQILRTNGLSQTDQPQNKLQSCWLTAWSSTWGSKKGSKKRSLFQWYDFLFSYQVHQLSMEALRTVLQDITRQLGKPETSAGHRTRLSGRGRLTTNSRGALLTRT